MSYPILRPMLFAILLSLAATHGLAQETATEPERTSYPVTVENCGQEITITQRPERAIVSHSGLVENMLELNLDDATLGQQWFFDGDAERRDPDLLERFLAIAKLGSDGAAASRETVVTLEPDFFYSGGSYDFGDGKITEEDLAASGVPIFRTTESCTDPQDQRIAPLLEEIRTLGVIFDVQDRAAEVVTQLEESIAATSAQVGELEPVNVVYIDGGNTDPIYVVPGGYYTDMIERAGGVNLFPEATYAAPLSVEELAVSMPDVVVIIEQDDWEEGLPTLREVFKNSPAGQNDRFVGIPVYGAGIRADENVEDLARIFHPEAFE